MGILTATDRRNQRTLEHHNEVARDGVVITTGARVVIAIGATIAVVALVVVIVAMLVESF